MKKPNFTILYHASFGSMERLLNTIRNHGPLPNPEMAEHPSRAYVARVAELLDYAKANGDILTLTPKGNEFIESVEGRAEMLQRDLFEIPRIRSLFIEMTDRIPEAHQGKQFTCDEAAKALAVVEPNSQFNKDTWKSYAGNLLSWYKAMGCIKKVNGKRFMRVRREEQIFLEARADIPQIKVSRVEAVSLSKSGWVSLDHFAADILAQIVMSPEPRATDHLIQELDMLTKARLADENTIAILKEELSHAEGDGNVRQNPQIWIHIARIVTALRKTLENKEKQATH